MQFADKVSYEDHIKQDSHKYSNLYATNKKYFRSANNGDIIIEVVPNHGSGSETTYVKTNDHFNLIIINTSDFEYEVVGIVQLNNRANEISTSTQALPLRLPKKGIVLQKITCRFTSISSVEYPQVFLCKQKSTEDIKVILKDLVSCYSFYSALLTGKCFFTNVITYLGGNDTSFLWLRNKILTNYRTTAYI